MRGRWISGGVYIGAFGFRGYSVLFWFRDDIDNGVFIFIFFGLVILAFSLSRLWRTFIFCRPAFFFLSHLDMSFYRLYG